MNLRAVPMKVYGTLLVLSVVVTVVFFQSPQSSSPIHHSPAAAIAGIDLEGNPVHPFASNPGGWVVLIFVRVDCPISNKYAPEIRRLHEEFTARGFRIWLVYPDTDTPVPELRRHQTEFQLPKDVLRDPEQTLVAFSQVTVTPEAAVFLPDGQRVYRGRIDNRHVDFGSSRPEATEHNLRHVLEQLANGKNVTPSSTQAVGCYINRNK